MTRLPIAIARISAINLLVGFRQTMTSLSYSHIPELYSCDITAPECLSNQSDCKALVICARGQGEL